MVQTDVRPAVTPLAERFRAVRELTEALAAPLSPEDQTAQSMPEVSPTKWHRAHTTWFFETFVLAPEAPGYRPYDPDYAYLFNSYYETVGPFFRRASRGAITRPGVAAVSDYRRYVDGCMEELFGRGLAPAAETVVELGCHHEQQHQELLLMDIKHVLSLNPARPAYAPDAAAAVPLPDRVPDPLAYGDHRRAGTQAGGATGGDGWLAHPGGLVEIGHDGGGFAFDNERPRHRVFLEPFELADDAVTNGDWLAFVEDGGYRRPELWLSEGWAIVRASGWDAPLYWARRDGAFEQFTLTGARQVDPAEPVCHVSFFEADAFARWAGARLPTEEEWEAVAATREAAGNLLDSGALHPRPRSGAPSLYGDVWQWTSSSYAPYPGFRPGPGSLGEYNGKFMANQYVLRGGCAVTPAGHVRATYRNFFPASARWAFSGLRLARDL